MPAPPKGRQPGQGQSAPSGEGTYSGRVEPPSSSYRQVQTNRVQLGVPENWREFRGESSVTYVPEGAYGEKGLTHGVLFGTEQAASSNLRQASQQYLESLLQGNPYLRQQSNSQNARIGGRSGLATRLAGRSPVTGRTELVTVLTSSLGNGELFYFTSIVPEEESRNYDPVFQRILSSLRFAR
jgi:hypothetical protein